MRVAVYSTKPYDRRFLDAANREIGHDLDYFEPRLTRRTAKLAADCPAVCAFVNDELDEPTLRALGEHGVRLIALRCAGFNNVDLAAAEQIGISIARVPAYSPHAVAEHTIALMMSLNRKIYRAHNRVREGNFLLQGLLGFDMAQRTAGVVGTGKIGAIVARILRGFGCKVLAFDVRPHEELVDLGVEYVTLDALVERSDIITLHCPLTPRTHHMIDHDAVGRMKPGVMLINTSRGALVNTPAVIEGLKSGRIGHLGLDVYEEEADLFFEDLSDDVLQDDIFARLLTFPNVLITSHQAFFTEEALEAIAATTIDNITRFERGDELHTAVHAIARQAAKQT